MEIALRFSRDEDLLRYEPQLDRWYPRTESKTGNIIRNWDVQHVLAMKEIDRLLRGMRSTADQFELGRLDPRSQENLRDVAALFALHFIFMACDNGQDETGVFYRKAKYYREQAEDMLRLEANQLDYDLDRDGSTSDYEKNQPIVQRIIRG